MDQLTSLPNRRYMQDYMKQVIASNRSNGMYSVMIMLDLDNFKILMAHQAQCRG